MRISAPVLFCLHLILYIFYLYNPVFFNTTTWLYATGLLAFAPPSPPIPSSAGEGGEGGAGVREPL